MYIYIPNHQPDIYIYTVYIYIIAYIRPQHLHVLSCSINLQTSLLLEFPEVHPCTDHETITFPIRSIQKTTSGSCCFLSKKCIFWCLGLPPCLCQHASKELNHSITVIVQQDALHRPRNATSGGPAMEVDLARDFNGDKPLRHSKLLNHWVLGSVYSYNIYIYTVGVF